MMALNRRQQSAQVERYLPCVYKRMSSGALHAVREIFSKSCILLHVNSITEMLPALMIVEYLQMAEVFTSLA